MSTFSYLKKRIPALVFFICIPFLIWMGITVYNDRNYTVFSIFIAILSCIPFFMKYEKRKPPAREIMVVSILCAIAISSRMLFAFLPGFKPVTAIIIIAAMAFGKETGFMCGAITALVSNIFFGQGPWTPFQMLSWGLIGYIAGTLNTSHHLERPLFLYTYGAIAGIVFSVIMDVWSAISIDGGFQVQRYVTLLATSIPFMITYIISNLIFLMVLAKPMMKKLERVKLKYGLLELEES